MVHSLSAEKKSLVQLPAALNAPSAHHDCSLQQKVLRMWVAHAFCRWHFPVFHDDPLQLMLFPAVIHPVFSCDGAMFSVCL